VVAVSDIDAARASSVAGAIASARVFRTGQELIGADDVDAVVVASWGAAHEESVLAAIERGKFVFCEKPLAPTIAECLRIVEAEVTRGRRFVQVGFMRRYDAGYRAMHEVITNGDLGAPLLMHCVHRNASVPSHITSDLLITDSAIHEIDLVRWLLNEEIAAARVLKPRRSRRSGDLVDPLLVILETAAGVLVDVEVFVNCVYGYDIKCEVVGESASVSLGDGSDTILRRDGRRSGSIPRDWRERFERAYDTELQAWLDSVAAGAASGPSAWDGYAATAVAETCLTALDNGQRAPVQLGVRPALYETRG
jgi:myo-inositol 2-dehydrogenase/D-chiro-inositol 1-dehydrogenase